MRPPVKTTKSGRLKFWTSQHTPLSCNVHKENLLYVGIVMGTAELNTTK